MPRVLRYLLLILVLPFGCAQGVSDIDRFTCMDVGGKWRKVCAAQTFRCVIPFADAGKSCTDSSACEGQCLADTTQSARPNAGEPATGICQRDNDPCGTFIGIRKGKALPPVHRD
jgi:hypothetical protein